MEEQQMYPTRRAAATMAFAEYVLRGDVDMRTIVRRAQAIALERRSGVLGFNHLMMACGVTWAQRRTQEPAQADGVGQSPQATGEEAGK